MCPNSRNALWALGRSAKAVLSWASGPPLLAAQPEGLAHLGSFSEHLGTVQDTSMGWERLSKKGRAWSEVSCHQLSPLNCTQSTRVTLGVSAVHTTGRDSPKRHLCDYANNTNERGTAKKGSGRQDPDITLRANLLPLEAGWLFSQSERQPG